MPPVPSVTDLGLYCFQSNNFEIAFPHKVHLQQVICQDEHDLTLAIQELCIGEPSPSTVILLKSLRHAIPLQDHTVHIFGTNFNVDMYNHDCLHKLPGELRIFRSSDKGNKKSIKLCKMPRCLALKKECIVIITQNLSNGLVNGLCAKVTSFHDREIQVQVEEDTHLPHGMVHKFFSLQPIHFDV